jgi:hypothetical protein
MECKGLIFKDNVGWDFGGAYHAFRAMQEDIGPDDYVMVRNRSTRGPSGKGWYASYVELLESSPRLVLAGSTIGFKDHPRRKREQDIIHVQTYVYVSRWKHLASLLPSFPGIHARTHHEAVFDGEIELSQQLMRKGGTISCLQFPEAEISTANQDQYFDFAGKQNLAGQRVGPIVKRPRVNPRTYYFQILPILITMIIYLIPRRRQYRVISPERTQGHIHQQPE